MIGYLPDAIWVIIIKSIYSVMLGRYEKTLIEYIKCLKILSDNGVYFISRYKADTNIYDLGGQQLDLLKILEKASS